MRDVNDRLLIHHGEQLKLRMRNVPIDREELIPVINAFKPKEAAWFTDFPARLFLAASAFYTYMEILENRDISHRAGEGDDH